MTRLTLPATPRPFSLLIDGKLIPVSEREPIVRENPAHCKPVSLYPRATVADAHAAIDAARRAADSRVWRDMSGAERARLLLRVARLIDENRVELREIESLEVGKPISLVDREINGTIAHWEYAATLARHAYGDTYDSLGDNNMAFVFREPIGVVSLITPWNYPFLILSQKLPFVLAVGGCAVVKPSELSSGTALRLGELLLEAGLPAGVVNILAGSGAELGDVMSRSPKVDMVSFTGSTTIGRIIGRVAGETLKKVSLELGGKAAHIVCADADLQLAAEKVALGATRNAGQACVGGHRLVVHESIADNFVEAVQKEISKLVVGDPLDPATTMGPVVSKVQFDRVNGYIAAGEDAGCEKWALQDRGAGALPGYFVQPTIFTGVQPSMVIAQEEIFGPVLSVMRFKTFDDALAIANSTPYGLSAGLWTRDLDTAFAFGRQLKAGTVEVNTFLAGAPELPLSGLGDSGVGHERGRFAIEEFTELRTIQLQLNQPRR
ncbi:aldehyde dehydrogenase family protein [Aureimonas fodinaquatilis]|uniref:Aldehyde dehydrogenase family protein n=1 Tax=Aureimonas fodinaquatilis TaxID=2565783 RepID=A0A5B0DTS4_9HYPH|nr:aldehyde dehydrogenase family protein [Aureimonas fodinaquatilis]KAA0970164.1 aldehyde dehydrogenase family protein [Aureimonas fodinaquatilis]